MACLEEPVGSILRGVCEVKMEITVMDGCRREILVGGGHFFQELASTQLTRAPLLSYFCKMHRIYGGFRVEITARGQRNTTTPVKSIEMVL